MEDADRGFIGPFPADDGVPCIGIRDLGVKAEETWNEEVISVKADM